MTDDASEVPPEAARRLAGRALSSGLSVPDFAACAELGLEPIGLVQGYCVMQWGFYANSSLAMRQASPYEGTGGQYVESYRCPHGFVSAEHRAWGQNYEQTWIERAWHDGFAAAYERMVAEARQIGAHGIIGVTDGVKVVGDASMREFQISGTAVVIKDSPAPAQPWTTYLAGQRLVKLIEAGWMPVAVTATLASVRVWAYCVTEYLMSGQSYAWGGPATGVEIEQVSRAHLAVRELARAQVRGQLKGDELHGVKLETREIEIGEGDQELQCMVRGTRVRRFKDFDPMPSPRPTVSLA